MRYKTADGTELLRTVDAAGGAYSPDETVQVAYQPDDPSDVKLVAANKARGMMPIVSGVSGCIFLVTLFRLLRRPSQRPEIL